MLWLLVWNCPFSFIYTSTDNNIGPLQLKVHHAFSPSWALLTNHPDNVGRLFAVCVWRQLPSQSWAQLTNHPDNVGRLFAVWVWRQLPSTVTANKEVDVGWGVWGQQEGFPSLTYKRSGIHDKIFLPRHRLWDFFNSRIHVTRHLLPLFSPPSWQIPEAVKRREPATEWVAAWLSFIQADIIDLRYRGHRVHHGPQVGHWQRHGSQVGH